MKFGAFLRVQLLVLALFLAGCQASQEIVPPVPHSTQAAVIEFKVSVIAAHRVLATLVNNDLVSPEKAEELQIDYLNPLHMGLRLAELAVANGDFLSAETQLEESTPLLDKLGVELRKKGGVL